MWKPRPLSQVSLNPNLLYNSISVQATSGEARKMFLKMAIFCSPTKQILLNTILVSWEIKSDLKFDPKQG